MHSIIPTEISRLYRAATDLEVRAESFGKLTIARIGQPGNWREVDGSFDDQRIFGPIRAYTCACGNYSGKQYANIICDRCGVKVTTPDARQKRCGHINLPFAIEHPIDPASQLLAVPVAPVSFIEARAGAGLLSGYEQILAASAADAAGRAFADVVGLFAPLLIAASQWNLKLATRIAHLMALVPLDRDVDPSQPNPRAK